MLVLLGLPEIRAINPKSNNSLVSFIVFGGIFFKLNEMFGVFHFHFHLRREGEPETIPEINVSLVSLVSFTLQFNPRLKVE